MKKTTLFLLAVCLFSVIVLSTVSVGAFAESVKEMLICENFESDRENYNLRSAKVVDDGVIGDKNSLLCKSTSEWNDFVTFKTAIAPNKTYTVAFRYNFVNVTSGAFAYVNIKSRSNVDDAAYLGFDRDGAVTDFGTNYVEASFDKGFYRTTAFVTFTVGDATDYALVFGAKGTVTYLLDDVTLVEGTEASIVDSEFVPDDELLFEENFEDGYGVLNVISGNFVPQGRLAYDVANVIDGKYSLSAVSANNTVVWLCGSGNVQLATDTVYTLLFRFRTDNKAKLCVAVNSDKHGQKSTLANFDEQGRLYSDMSYNVASYVTEHKDGYAATRIIFTTPSEGNLQLRFGVRGGKVSLDNVRLYKNAADVSFEDEPTFEEGGSEQPALTLPGANKPAAVVRYDKGKVIDKLNVVFDEFVLPASENLSVALKIDGKRTDCEASFDINAKTVNVVWDGEESKYKYVTLKIAEGAFVNADELASDEISVTFFNGSDDVKAFVDAWEQVQYGDAVQREVATETAMKAYEKLSDKQYFAEQYETVKKLADWYAQENKPDQPSGGDEKNDKGCGATVKAASATALAMTVATAAFACGKKDKKTKKTANDSKR